jgi:hypothetical protein
VIRRVQVRIAGVVRASSCDDARKLLEERLAAIRIFGLEVEVEDLGPVVNHDLRPQF